MRVLILSATTGGGHMRAAQALKECVMRHEPDSQIMIIDAIQYISPILNKTVAGGYVYMAKNTPQMYGFMYKASDKETNPLNHTVTLATTQFGKRFLPLIDEFKPDIMVSTHSFACDFAAGLKVKGLIDVPLVSIITDFAAHQTYLTDGVDAYIVSTQEMVNEMVSRGVLRSKIYDFGIPVHQAFYEKEDRRLLLQEEGLNPDVPTILIMAGSFGVTDVLKIYHKIVKSPVDFQIVVITGKNEKLFETFERYLRKLELNNAVYQMKQNASDEEKVKIKLRASRKIKASKPTRLLYYTDRVERYMQMADLIVTKPGGLTVSESIVSNLPMAIFKAIPGQEEQNASFLVGKGMAVRLEKKDSCTRMITRLFTEENFLADMKQAVHDFNRGNSAENLYNLMTEMISKKSEQAE